MKVYTSDKIRNVVVMGHGGSGKTSFLEMLLYRSGAATRLGSVVDGTSVCNYDPEEVKRQISILAKVVPIESNGAKVNFIDTPGYADFIGEILCGFRAADCGLVLISAVAGLEVQAHKAWKMMQEVEMPRGLVINKCDRENVNIDTVVANLKSSLSQKCVLLQCPIEPGAGFQGVVDVLSGKATVYKGDKAEATEVPAALKEKVAALRLEIVEAAVESDDALMEKYLEGGEISADELSRALKTAVLKGLLFPIFCVSSTKAIGGAEALELVNTVFPAASEMPALTVKDAAGKEITVKADDAEPVSAFAFKVVSEPQLGELVLLKLQSGKLLPGAELANTKQGGSERMGHLLIIRAKNREEVPEVHAGDIVALAKLKNTVISDTLADAKRPVVFPAIEFLEPVVDFSIKTESRKDQEKLGNAIGKILAVDPTIRLQMDPEFNQTIIKGMGDVHIEITMHRLKERYGVDAHLDKPLIPYRETIKGAGDSMYRHKKQTGGAGQFGEVWVKVAPRARGEGFLFEDEIVGGAIPRQFIPSCEKGIRESLKDGVLAGYPIVDVSAAIYDGKSHPVDSKDIAFQIAARYAFKQALEKARPVLLEPIMNVEITVPGDYVGDVTGNLNQRRGRIVGIDVVGEFQVIKATVPQQEMYGYSGDLRSMTQGTGYYTMAVDHFEEVPAFLADKVIAEAKKRREEAKEKKE